MDLSFNDNKSYIIITPQTKSKKIKRANNKKYLKTAVGAITYFP